MVGAYAPCARFIHLARQSGLEALFLNVSFVGSSALARELGSEVDGVLVTQVVPDPLDTSLPLVREYRADLHRSAPQATPNVISLEGYVAARILLRAVERLEGPAGRETLIDALEGLGSFDLGLGQPLRLAPGEHQASRTVWPTRLAGGGFVPFDWTAIGSLLPPAETAP
jgi:ABC-type branched-subunit amino acid transport system substrate-binding protein